ncbi:MAG: Crp/Fnr family transcriptional regulator [Lachnospiraceae bacterium]|nr:Crp/Fnr family transcriptional regulator [Lachnospiraceae bacterium]
MTREGLEEAASSPLFEGVKPEEIEIMMGCLKGKKKHFNKGETIFNEGESLKEFALLLKGSIIVESEDYWGNRSIMQKIEAPDIFGEAYAASDEEPLLNYIVAAEDTDVLFMDSRDLMTVCSKSCSYHNTLIQNLFMIMAEKNRRLTGKLRHLSKRTTREKILSYLSEIRKKSGKEVFDIPFNRQQLADYLSVDRSALSAELSKMQKEGLIRYQKSTFELLKAEEE